MSDKRNGRAVSPDDVELAYHQAIARAIRDGDNDEALHQSIGLAQYRDLYRADHRA